MNRIFATEADGTFTVPVLATLGTPVQCQTEALGILCNIETGVLTAPITNAKTSTDTFGVLIAESDMAIARNQTPTFVARITKASGEIIDPASISAIAYTIQKLSNTGLTSGQTYVDVTGHVNVSVPLSSLKPIPISDAFWQDMQTSGYTEPEDSIDGVLIHATRSGTDEVTLDLYFDGVLVDTQTTTDSGIGSNLQSVTVATGKAVTYNTSRTVAIALGTYKIAGGTDSTAGSVSSSSEVLATASSVGTWSNYSASSTSAIRGYNFSAEPNTVTTTAFADTGTYSVQFKLTPVSGNPIVASWQVKVSQ